MKVPTICVSPRWRIAVSLTAMLLASCERKEQQGLLERIDALEAELVTRDEKIQQLRSELAQREKQESEQEPEIDLAKASYKEATEGIAQSLRGLFQDQGRVDDVIVSDVTVHDPDYPIASALDVVFSTRTGQWRVKIPMRASSKGRWESMDESMLKEHLKQSRQLSGSQPAVTQQSSANPAPAPAKPELPRDVMGAQKTEVIDWGDQPPARRPQQPQAQQPQTQQPAPQRPAVPPKVMPTDRDVMIDFGD